jgi:hypothetical protein
MILLTGAERKPVRRHGGGLRAAVGKRTARSTRFATAVGWRTAGPAGSVAMGWFHLARV